ncbi:Uncharacterised protein [Amycolatopsis camponoti]|uniref:Uncharacterized protein n=1 Tax=Amycolatopsis camponoti TaxID=2606593 RepID=A0A6I8LR75_9PSEU|nr:Uncharacterised protein [Amycolatopsis camponoti]
MVPPSNRNCTKPARGNHGAERAKTSDDGRSPRDRRIRQPLEGSGNRCRETVSAFSKVLSTDNRSNAWYADQNTSIPNRNHCDRAVFSVGHVRH